MIAVMETAIFIIVTCKVSTCSKIVRFIKVSNAAKSQNFAGAMAGAGLTVVLGHERSSEIRL
jgi:hypothetical protein